MKDLHNIRLLFVSGMSGAGKTQAMRTLEDMGYFCIDNLPASLVVPLVELFLQNSRQSALPAKIAIAVDVRGKEFLQYFEKTMEMLDREKIQTDILYLDASDQVLVNRYKETRRKHPLQEEDSMLSAIQRERVLLSGIRSRADRVIDTSQLAIKEFSELMYSLYGMDEPRMIVAIQSFGFKHGIPLDADLVMDVRFLPNPYYYADMTGETGLSRKVRDFVLESGSARAFLDHYVTMLSFLLPEYVKEGKKQLVIAVGCTGGQHRSVVLAEEIGQRLEQDERVRIMISHRDLPEGSR